MPVEINNTTKNKINLKIVAQAAELFLKKYHKSKQEVSIAFVGDQKIKKLNQAYRGTDKVTDILSFAGDGNLLGELIINYNQIKKQAQTQKKTVTSELVFIVVHGLLHLIGYEDDTEEQLEQMKAIGTKFIKQARL